MDRIDERILAILRQNSKLSNKEIGAAIHLTGQAVGKRIARLQEMGVIQRFSIDIRYATTQFIRIFMDSNRYASFEEFVSCYQEITAVYKVSGQACYMLISHFKEADLADFFENVSKWGRYSLETVVADKTIR